MARYTAFSHICALIYLLSDFRYCFKQIFMLNLTLKSFLLYNIQVAVVFQYVTANAIF